MSKVEYVVHGSPLLNDHFTCILGVCTISYVKILNGVISTAVYIKLRRDLENCLYIDGWCAPGVHTGTRAHRRFKPVFN